MRAGEMKDRIDLLQPVDPPGPVTDMNGNWEDYKTGIWAKVEYLKATEFWNVKAVNAETSIRFIIRYRQDVTTEMAVRFENRILNIISAIPLDNKRQWIIITAKEVIPSG